MHRKRIGFSQREIALLLNCRHGAAISRYERRSRRPSLETAFALEIIYRTPIRELYAGVYDDVSERVIERLLEFQNTMQNNEESKRTEHHIIVLKEILSSIQS